MYWVDEVLHPKKRGNFWGFQPRPPTKSETGGVKKNPSNLLIFYIKINSHADLCEICKSRYWGIIFETYMMRNI